MVAERQLTTAQEKLAGRMIDPRLYFLFALRRLPSTAFWGLRVAELAADKCVVTLPYGWRTQNPFRSIYFAAQCGAGELSTGALALLHLEGKAKTSMLVTGFRSQFYKKATADLRLVCEDGHLIGEAVRGTLESGGGTTVAAKSRAFLPDGTLASEFEIIWSFKRKT